jgi:hypothetical protein
MAAETVVTGQIETAKRLVDLLEKDGFQLDGAVWAADSDGHGRLYLVPSDLDNNNRDELRQTVRVAYTISAHREELPDRHDLKYSIVSSKHPVIQAVRSASAATGKLQGLYNDGTYIETAYVLRPAA